MRVLYVALTRAKEKLILSGAYKPEEIPQDAILDGKLASYKVRNANNYLDWLAPLAVNDENWVMNEIDPEDVLPMEETKDDTAGTLDQAAYNERVYRSLEKRMSYQYPYAWKEALPSRLSVSQLKKTGEEETFSERTLLYAAPEEEEDDRPSGSRQGTAIHKVLSLLDLGQMDAIELQLDGLERMGRLTNEERSMVPVKELQAFAESTLIRRMRASAQVLKEQPFIVRIPVGRIRSWIPEWMAEHPEVPEDAEIMVQGIIDVCFQEGDGWVIADYKSDRYWDAARVEMYGRQLRLYAYALERITDLPVHELLLYRTRTAEEIPVDLEQKGTIL